MSQNRVEVSADKAIFAMLAVMTGITLASGSDLATKWLSDQMSIWQLQLMRSVIGAAVLAAAVLIANKDASLIAINGVTVFIRSFLMAISFLTYFIAIGILPIAIVAAGLFSSPLFTVFFGRFILKEKVGLFRISFAFIGFFGVVLVLQPGTTEFEPALLWPLGCGFSYALTNTYTRKYCLEENPLALSFWLSVLFAVIGLIGMIGFSFSTIGPEGSNFVNHPPLMPDPTVLGVAVGIGICSIAMHFFLATAYQNAPASLLAPLEYVYLPLVIFGGIFFFGEQPTSTAYLGIAVIVFSGIVIAWREQRVGARKKPKRRRPKLHRKQPDYY
jgi:drug/metabolite transporter (DMT)-like permease